MAKRKKEAKRGGEGAGIRNKQEESMKRDRETRGKLVGNALQNTARDEKEKKKKRQRD